MPLADDPSLAIAELSVRIDPTPENGCAKPSYALAHHVTTTSKARIRGTGSRITPHQLTDIRQRIAITIGVD